LDIGGVLLTNGWDLNRVVFYQERPFSRAVNNEGRELTIRQALEGLGLSLAS
jgi:hypothetical protein